jgi:hypothetical protein
VTGGWIKVHNDKLHKLYSLPSIIRMVKSREMRLAEHLLAGKPEGKTPLGRPRHRWMDNIKMDIGEIEWGDVDWIGMAQDRNRL